MHARLWRHVAPVVAILVGVATTPAATRRHPDDIEKLRRAFDETIDEDARFVLAAQILDAGLEKNKPLPAPPRRASDRDFCAPAPDMEPARISLVWREVEWILQPRNRCYLELLGLSTRIRGQGDYWAPLVEWSKSLRDPAARVAFWRRVHEQLAATDGATSVEMKLVAALAEWAAALLPGGAAQADALLGEALRLHRSMQPEGSSDSLDESLRELQRRAWRLQSPAPPAWDLSRLAGTYRNSAGFGSDTIALRNDGTFTRERCGDSGDACDGTCYRDAGTAVVEGDHLVFTSDDRRLVVGRVQQLFPVPWGPLMYLVAEPQMLDFCNYFNDGRLPRIRTGSDLLPVNAFYLNTKTPAAPPGKPLVPRLWTDYLLNEPVAAHVTAVADDLIMIDAGADAGLRPGMFLWTMTRSEDYGAWQVVMTAPNGSLAVPFSRRPATPGLELCTRLP